MEVQELVHRDHVPIIQRLEVRDAFISRGLAGSVVWRFIRCQYAFAACDPLDRLLDAHRDSLGWARGVHEQRANSALYALSHPDCLVCCLPGPGLLMNKANAGSSRRSEFHIWLVGRQRTAEFSAASMPLCHRRIERCVHHVVARP